MANFLDNFRAATQQIGLPFATGRASTQKAAPTTFRDATNGEETTYQMIKLSKPDKHFSDEKEQYAYDEDKDTSIILIVPAASKTKSYSDYRTGGDTSNRIRERAVNRAKNDIGIGLMPYSGKTDSEGEVLGLIDADGNSYTAQGALKYLDQLNKAGYRITSYQQPTYSDNANDGYYPLDLLRAIVPGVKPVRGTVTAKFTPAQQNTEVSQFMKNLREGMASRWQRK